MVKIHADSSGDSVFTPLKTTDDDDDEEQLAGDGGPTATRYHDDPRRSGAEDDPGSSVFDWGDSGGGGGGEAKKKNFKNSGATETVDFDADEGIDGGFAPVSLRDDSDDDDDDEGGEGSNLDGECIRFKANKILNQRIFDDMDAAFEGEDDRIFVGGGWGRHGSQFSCCPRGLLCKCCGNGGTKPSYSKGPPPKKGRSPCAMACLVIAFLIIVIGAGTVGYEAGLPANEDVADGYSEDGNGTGTASLPHHHTRGEEWLQWLEKEKEEIEAEIKNSNFTLHRKKNKKNPAFKKPNFEAMTQTQLLHVSENIFQSCSERSLRTAPGRGACLSQCHGHYCCFERDAAYGSCVAEANSYCFAYAACENAIEDFGMNNVAGAGGDGPAADGAALDPLDLQLLGDACAGDSVATLEGIRDCNALCRHHLCCFSGLEEENCREEHAGECEAYDSCSVLMDGPGDVAATVDDDAAPAVTVAFKNDCMRSNLLQNRDICKNHCAPYECCFRTVDSCYKEKDSECDDYYLCEEFFLDEEEASAEYLAKRAKDGEEAQPGQSDPDRAGDGPDGVDVYYDDVELTGVEHAVDAACGLHGERPGDNSWVAACHALCADHLCCLSDAGTQSNCQDAYGEKVCYTYRGCAVLTAPGDEPPQLEPPPPGADAVKPEDLKDLELREVRKACVSREQLANPQWADRCRRACDVRACCFEDGPGNCYSMNKGWCDEFEACLLLHS